MSRPIDADDLYRKIKMECNKYGKPTIGFEDGCKVLNIINKQSTVDAMEVVHAHWIVKGDDDMDNEMYHCSNCKHEEFFDSYYEQEKYPFCPSCGAKMDESVRE